jgi:hypothetical protein
MSLYSLHEQRERRRGAANAVFDEVAAEVEAARNKIIERAIDRIITADPQAMFSPTLERLGQIWLAAWPYTVLDKDAS